MIDYKWYFRIVERKLGILDKIDKGKIDDFGNEEMRDMFYSYFVLAYHVKDYLINDPSYLIKSGSEVEQYININPELSICADICNGFKHCKEIDSRSGGLPIPKGGEVYMRFEDSFRPKPGVQESKMQISYKMKLEHNGTVYDGLELANKIHELWKAIM